MAIARESPSRPVGASAFALHSPLINMTFQYSIYTMFVISTRP
jgi:hypothetical protein